MLDGLRITLFNLFFYAFTFVVALGLWVLAKVSTQARMQRLAQMWGRTVRGAVRLILDGRIEVRGLENVPTDRPVMLVAKHQSELDIVMLAALFPNASAVAMDELRRYPFFGPVLEALDVVLVAVDRGRQGRTRQAVEGARRIFAAGRPMAMYPEGELMKLGARERYRRGAGHIYVELGPTVVPVAKSLGAIWPQRRWRKCLHRTGAIEFLEPIEPGLDLDTFMAEIERRIETATMALIREHADGEDLAEAERRYAMGHNNFDRPAAAPEAAQ